MERKSKRKEIKTKKNKKKKLFASVNHIIRCETLGFGFDGSFFFPDKNRCYRSSSRAKLLLVHIHKQPSFLVICEIAKKEKFFIFF